MMIRISLMPSGDFFFDSGFEVVTAMDAHHARAILKEMPVSSDTTALIRPRPISL